MSRRARRGGKYGSAPEPAVVFRSAPALLLRVVDALACELYREAEYRRRGSRMGRPPRLERRPLEVRATWYRVAADRAGISWAELEIHLERAFGSIGGPSTLSAGVRAEVSRSSGN